SMACARRIFDRFADPGIDTEDDLPNSLYIPLQRMIQFAHEFAYVSGLPRNRVITFNVLLCVHTCLTKPSPFYRGAAPSLAWTDESGFHVVEQPQSTQSTQRNDYVLCALCVLCG